MLNFIFSRFPKTDAFTQINSLDTPKTSSSKTNFEENTSISTRISNV